MSENKFIEKLKGQGTAKSVLEVKNQNVHTSFGNMPKGASNANDVYIDHSGDAIGVLQGAENWKLNGNTLVYASSVSSNGNDYTGETDKTGGSVVLGGDGMAVSGAGLWVNATYTFSGDPTKTVAIFNAGTKWALKLCGHSLFSENETIDLTVLIKIGTSSVISKAFTVTKDSFNFCKDLVIDFTESVQSTIKVLGNQTLTLQLLCSDATASATIYNGMTVLTSLQRRVDMDVIAGGGYSLDGLETELDSIHSELAGKLNLDGTNTMTGVLKMRASVSFQCAIAPYWDGVGFYKLNDDDSVSLMASIEATQGFLPAGTNVYAIGSSAHKWKDLYLGGKAYIATINNGGDIAVPTKAGTMALESDIGRTNCITEIPQDIKLELNAGTFTVKAGSKVYVPNGFEEDGITPKFDVLIIENDISATGPVGEGDGKYFIYINITSLQLNWRKVSNTYSGTSDPGTLSRTYYNTGTNIITSHNTGGDIQVSLPFGIITTLNSQFNNIDQVFNGFGFIGRIVFALPGVKALIPSGRNADGTLKSRLDTLSSVKTADGYTCKFMFNIAGISAAYFTNYVEQDTQPSFTNGAWYNPLENKMYQITNSVVTELGSAYVLDVVLQDGDHVKSVIPKMPFRAVDYSDTEFIANQAMPSDRYVNLTLGTSGTTYTAPADGWYTVRIGTSASEYLLMTNTSNNLASGLMWPGAGGTVYGNISVSKGDVVTIDYNASGAVVYFRFVYANGAK